MPQLNLDNVDKFNIRGKHISQNRLYLKEESLVVCKLFNWFLKWTIKNQDRKVRPDLPISKAQKETILLAEQRTFSIYCRTLEYNGI